eukprot:CAMPEP_0198248504 /NCGR_PEP_ID=MMETSP1447-20131203/255_1 /TAXON_ID=420782 /ORGANISM="Chaetoceros dichaeta, Strain CCMP1751" /LENGTH=211 /DNA_ID=CAMNT_0043932911 /DNA_START=62 /DNA_END=697 /DNA_ORIENTATION=+
MTVTSTSPASEIIDAFFEAIDLDSSGCIDEAEALVIAKIGFGQDEETAAKYWKEDLCSEDSNHDNKLSKEEYVAWWTKKSDGKKNDDGTFEKKYAESLISSLTKVQSVAEADALCTAFFDVMDIDGSGAIEENEAKTISKKGFGADEAAATANWKKMLTDMDTNEDGKISKEEYTAFWMSEAKDKLQSNGSFAAGYTTYLWDKLETLKAAE